MNLMFTLAAVRERFGMVINPKENVNKEMVEKSCRMIRICNVCGKKQQKCCCFHKKRSKGNTTQCEECISAPFCQQIEINKFKNVPRFYEVIRQLPPITGLSLQFDCPYLAKVDIGPKITPRQVKILKKRGLPWIAVSLQELLKWSRYPEKRKLELKIGCNKNLHEITGFSGKILLLTNIRDALCELILNNPQKFLEILSILKPDAVTTPDANFYYELPKFAAQIQFQRIFNLTRQMMTLNIPLVGLVPPRLDCIDPALRAFHKIGVEIVGLPLMEIYKYRNNSRDYRVYLKRLNEQLNNNPLRKHFKVLAISVSPLNPENYNYYTSKSWTIIPGLKHKSHSEREMIWLRLVKIKKMIKNAAIKSRRAEIYQYNMKLDRFLKEKIKMLANVPSLNQIDEQNQISEKIEATVK